MPSARLAPVSTKTASAARTSPSSAGSCRKLTLAEGMPTPSSVAGAIPGGTARTSRSTCQTVQPAGAPTSRSERTAVAPAATVVPGSGSATRTPSDGLPTHGSDDGRVDRSGDGSVEGSRVRPARPRGRGGLVLRGLGAHRAARHEHEREQRRGGPSEHAAGHGPPVDGPRAGLRGMLLSTGWAVGQAAAACLRMLPRVPGWGATPTRRGARRARPALVALVPALLWRCWSRRCRRPPSAPPAPRPRPRRAPRPRRCCSSSTTRAR